MVALLAIRLSSNGFSARLPPTKHPPTRQNGGFPELITQLDHSSSGAPEIHCCHAENTCGTLPDGKRRENTVSAGAGTVLKVNEVTMPRLPPPPPRSVQNRSGSEEADASTSRASAVITLADTRESHVRPNFLVSTPIPPP